MIRSDSSNSIDLSLSMQEGIFVARQSIKDQIFVRSIVKIFTPQVEEKMDLYHPASASNRLKHQSSPRHRV
jgi:hypothetical protein